MSKITVIEKAIVQLGSAEFQDFCDAFLSKKDQYGKILARGKQPGFSKTTTGNPDTYFYETENGKYVFVAYTTEQGNIYSKLKKDIEKCLDPDKTKLRVKDIDEIICCHTSSNLDAGDDQKLHELCDKHGVKLTLYSINQIAQEIYQNYPILARDILGVSIDTNQILSVEDFIAEYDASETAAPLNTVFLSRKKELELLKKGLHDKKVVVVHGTAGVGKTRIVLEAIRSFSQEENYKVLCVKNRNLGLFEDLIANMEKPGRYLFFVDDANELCGLNLILDYLLKENTGFTVKIIMTVRDYVKRSVVQTVFKYVVPELIEISAFSDDEIAEFLNINMGITNDRFIDTINKVATGNPRVAYMAGKIAIDTQSIVALSDVTDVYESYYDSIIVSRLENDRNLCYTAGVLALVQAVIMDQLDDLDEIIRLGNMKRDEFVACISQLYMMEVVDIHMDKYAAISDQCFANYILYHVFFVEKRAPFSKVLVIGFKHFTRGVLRSTNIILNLFLRESLKGYIETEIKTAWKYLEEQNDPCFDEFVKTFHVFMPEEGFLKAIEKIEKIPEREYDGKQIDFEKGGARYDDEILGLLTGYCYTHHLGTVIEILKDYVSKSAENAVMGFNWLKNEYGINHISRKYSYYNEKMMLEFLGKCLYENSILMRFILAYVSYALSFEFSSTEAGRGYTFKFYTIPLENTKGVSEYRKECWLILEKMLMADEIEDMFLNVIVKYASSVHDASDRAIVLDDQPFIEKIIPELKCSDIQKAKIIRDLQRGWNKHLLSYPDYTAIFDSEDWKVYTLLENEWLYTDLEYEEYEKKRAEKLIDYAESMPVNCIKTEISRINRLIENDRDNTHNRYYLNEGVNHILNCLSKEFIKSLEAFNALMTEGNDLDIRPECLFATLFQHMKADEIWRLIEDVEFPQKNQWKFYYFQMLPVHRVNEYEYKKMLCYLENESDHIAYPTPLRDISFLDKYLKCDPNVYVTASRLIVNKGTSTSTIYFKCLFVDSVYTPLKLRELYAEDIDLLKDIYFSVLGNAQSADYKGTFLANFLTIDDSWLDMYVNSVLQKVKKGAKLEHNHYKALWLAEDYLNYYNRIFYRVCEGEGISEWRIEKLYKDIFRSAQEDSIIKYRQIVWISQIIKENAYDKRIIRLFALLSVADESLQRIAIREFIDINKDYEMFRKLPLCSYGYGGSENEIISIIGKRIKYLESLLHEVRGVKYLKHANRINKEIDRWKMRLKQEEMEIVLRKLYR